MVESLPEKTQPEKEEETVAPKTEGADSKSEASSAADEESKTAAATSDSDNNSNKVGLQVLREWSF